MQELISPAQSEKLVLLCTLLLALVGGAWGFKVRGAVGALAALPGLLIWPLWQLHKYLTRFDPQSGYFGLDKVNVLLGEVVLFVVLGAALGWAWGRFQSTTENTENTEK